MDEEIKPKKDWFHTKFAFMVVFVTLDVYLNSKAEYEALLVAAELSLDELSQLQMLLCGSGILLQFSLASAFFLILCNTFPFQVGIINPIF